MYLTLIIRYWKTAMFALLIAAVLGSIAYMHYLKNKAEDYRQERDAAQSELKRKDALINAMATRYEALQQVQRDRVADQNRIEGTKHERLIADRATLAKPENRAVADIELPADMLDGLRE